MEPEIDAILSEVKNTDNEPSASFDETLHFSLDPILDNSTPKSTEQSKTSSETSFKPHTSGKRHSILGSGNRSAFRKPNLSELREKYRKAKERVKEWKVDKLWASHVERVKKNAVTSLSEIVTAAFWIREGVPRTACEATSSIPEIDEIDVYFKREYQNPSGSFHDRGARYALLRLHQSQKNLGAVTTSSGNYAVALAFQGSSLGIPVSVLLPENTSPVKIRMCEKYNADTMVSGLDEGELREMAIEIEKERGLAFIDEKNKPDIVCGQGTMGLEIVDQLEEVDAIIVPAVRSEKKLDYRATIHEGKTVATTESKDLTTVDDLEYSEISDAPLILAESLMDKCVTVKEDHVALAVLRLLEYEKVILEADGAAGLAALVGGYLPELKGKRVVVVLSEGNMEPALLPRVIARGLTMDGRLVRFEVRIDDRLGTMATLLRLITSTGAVCFPTSFYLADSSGFFAFGIKMVFILECFDFVLACSLLTSVIYYSCASSIDSEAENEKHFLPGELKSTVSEEGSEEFQIKDRNEMENSHCFNNDQQGHGIYLEGSKNGQDKTGTNSD
ncbi:hypothetical protein ACROYT_G043756 [Oculina patagonica]